MFGLGWALTGACPGPLVALVGAGVPVMAGHDSERARRHVDLWKASAEAPALTHVTSLLAEDKSTVVPGEAPDGTEAAPPSMNRERSPERDTGSSGPIADVDAIVGLAKSPPRAR